MYNFPTGVAARATAKALDKKTRAQNMRLIVYFWIAAIACFIVIPTKALTARKDIIALVIKDVRVFMISVTPHKYT